MDCLLKEHDYVTENRKQSAKFVFFFSDFLENECFLNLMKVSCEIQMSEEHQRHQKTKQDKTKQSLLPSFSDLEK